jgi:hypothetical protein
MRMNFTSDEIAAYQAWLAKASIDVASTVVEQPTHPDFGYVSLNIGATLLFVFLLNYMEQHQLKFDEEGDEGGLMLLLSKRNSFKELKFLGTVSLISLPFLISQAIEAYPDWNVTPDASAAVFLAISTCIGLALLDPIRDSFIHFYKEWKKGQKIKEILAEKALEQKNYEDFQKKRLESIFEQFTQYLVAKQQVDTEEGKKRKAEEEKKKKMLAAYLAAGSIDDRIDLGRKLGYSDEKIYRDLMKKYHHDTSGRTDDTQKLINTRYNKFLRRFA